MGLLDEILNNQSPDVGIGPGAQSHSRAMDIADIARANGFLTPLDPRFAQQFPDLAAEWRDITVGQVAGLIPGLGSLGSAARSGGGPSALPPPRAGAVGEVIRSTPGGPGPSLPPGGPVIEGQVVPPRGAAGSAPTGSSSPPSAGLPPVGNGVPGGGYPTAPGPGAGSSSPPSAGLPPVGNGVPGGGYPTVPGVSSSTASAAGSQAATSGGLLGSIKDAANRVRQNPLIAAGLGAGALAAGVPIGVGIGALASANRTPAPSGPVYGPSLADADANAAAIKAAEDKKRADEARARQIRGDNADISLTEAQAGYYEAQMAKIRAEIAKSDLSDKDKVDLEHYYDSKLQAEIAGYAMDREGAATERTIIGEEGADRRAQAQDATTRRGQDIQQNDATARFVNSFLQNQIANGQLSLDKATKIMEAYQNQQKLPAEILESVTRSVQSMAPYMTNRQSGDQPDYVKKYGQSKHYEVNSPGTSDFNPFQMAKDYGAVPPPPGQMPSVDQVFQGAGQGADMSQQGLENVRSMYPSGAASPSDFSSPMPDDSAMRIQSGLR